MLVTFTFEQFRNDLSRVVIVQVQSDINSPHLGTLIERKLRLKCTYVEPYGIE